VMVDGKPLTRDDRQRLGERHADHHLHYRSRAFPRKSDHSCRRRCAYLPDFVIVDRDIVLRHRLALITMTSDPVINDARNACPHGWTRVLNDR
jgi:hypothetical protein